ncbi:MAG: hemerythrin family protein [Deltaproteobacteria bacterium]|nr:hemerythrin family protein [Deltaproteobacteria bacterium]
MPFMVWEDNKFSVNINHLDVHHKRLFSLVNDLYDAMKGGKAKEVLGKILTELINYTVYHFGAEEELFQKYGYPEYRQHKKEHEDLTNQAKDLKDRFDKGEVVALTMETMHFLRDWLNNHICGSDKKYAPFLNSKGIA